MINKLNIKDINYTFEIPKKVRLNNSYKFPEYKDVYEELKRALSIKEHGYNLFIIDDFNKSKLDDLMKNIKYILKDKKEQRDICYVSLNDAKTPYPIFVTAGLGNKFKEAVDELKKLYYEYTYEFYNGTTVKSKEAIVSNIQKNRSDAVSKLIKVAKEEGFEMKVTDNGFSFIPVKDGELMSEKEYDDLGEEEKGEILEKVSTLKNRAQDVLNHMNKDEESEIEKIKELLKNYYKEKMREKLDNFFKVFKDEESIISYIESMSGTIESEIINGYSLYYDEDEEGINEVVWKYNVNVIVDNSHTIGAPVIFEEDPTVANLLGNIEYETKNGNYITDISMIKAGSLLKANGGCLIIRLNSLISSSNAYHYLKKSIMNGKVSLDFNKGYLELLSLNSLSPLPVEINEKIILIGDGYSYDVLYNYDEDFKKIFKLRAEFDAILECNDESSVNFVKSVKWCCKKLGLYKVQDEAIVELAKYLSRKIGEKNRINVDSTEILNILTLAKEECIEKRKKIIDGETIKSIVYKEEKIEKEIIKAYKDKKLFINVEGQHIGEVNGLSVLDTGYASFGKCIRITCNCTKGSGQIIDIQKESNLSGKIHIKSINILKGLISTIVGGYKDIPVDFYLSFEQMYGMLDGDSASVAECVAMISSLTKLPVKSYLAVTGSINQFGEVQPIGGANEKIEGFFKVCKELQDVKGKGVVLPKSNVNNIILTKEVEEEIEKGNFSLYTIESLNDALEILLGMKYEEIIKILKCELKKYEDKKKKEDSKNNVKKKNNMSI